MIENYGTFDHMSQAELRSFDTMCQVVAHIKQGLPLYYRAPLDYRPVCVYARPFGKVRVYIRGNGGYDGFTADVGHLNRFRRKVG